MNKISQGKLTKGNISGADVLTNPGIVKRKHCQYYLAFIDGCRRLNAFALERFTDQS